jgi:hypothetical protein
LFVVFLCVSGFLARGGRRPKSKSTPLLLLPLPLPIYISFSRFPVRRFFFFPARIAPYRKSEAADSASDVVADLAAVHAVQYIYVHIRFR